MPVHPSSASRRSSDNQYSHARGLLHQSTANNNNWSRRGKTIKKATQMDSPKQIFTQTSSSATSLFFIVILCLCCCSSIQSAPPATGGGSDSQTTIGCNGASYAAGDPFTTSLVYILPDLQKATPNQKGYEYRNVSPYPTSLAYGHATCSSTTSSSDCATCLVTAVTSMLIACDKSVGVTYKSSGCSMRYEKTPITD